MACFKTSIFAFLATAVLASPALAYHRNLPTQHFVQRHVQVARETAFARTAAGETFASLPHAKAGSGEWQHWSFVQTEPRRHRSLVMRLPPDEPRQAQKAWSGSGPRGGSQSGIASWYGAGGMTAASVTLPMGSMARVTRDDGRSVVVRIADRGPFIRGRIIDLSRSAAGALGIIGSGVTHVRVDPL